MAPDAYLHGAPRVDEPLVDGVPEGRPVVELPSVESGVGVGVRVEVDDGDGAVLLGDGPQGGQGERVVAAEHQEGGVVLEEFAQVPVGGLHRDVHVERGEADVPAVHAVDEVEGARPPVDADPVDQAGLAADRPRAEAGAGAVAGPPVVGGAGSMSSTRRTP